MSEQTLSGFLPLSRKFFEHHFWTKKRVYSPAEAWLDLLAMACYEPEATMIVNNRTVKWKQGEVFASVRYLAKRWKWSNAKVVRFIDNLEEESMITRAETKSGTIIVLTNYDKYNKTATKSEHQTEHLKSIGVKVSKELRNTEKNSDEYTDRNTKRNTKRNSKRVQLKPDAATVSAEMQNTERNTEKNSDEYTDRNKIKNLINKNTMTASANAAAYPPEFVAKYQHLKDWIAANAPRVGQMKEPITIEQAFKLRGTIDPKLLSDILTAMHNYEPLLKKNRSTYLTIKNWQRRREQSQPGIRKPISTPTALGSHDIRRIKKEEEDTLRLANGQL